MGGLANLLPGWRPDHLARARHGRVDSGGLAGFSGLGNGVSHRSYGVEIYARLWRGLGVSFATNGAWSAQGIAAGALYRIALSFER